MTKLFLEKIIKLQLDFSFDLCKEIFKDDHEHLFNKWLYYDSNLLIFINSLDNYNKQKIFDWCDINL